MSELKINPTNISIDNIPGIDEIAKLNIEGNIYLHDSQADNFAGLIMRPANGNRQTQIQVQGDDNVVHTALVVQQVAPTGTGTPTDSRLDIETMNGGARAARLTIDQDGWVGIDNTSPKAPLHVGAGADTPITSNAAIYAAREDDTAIVARDTADNIEAFMFAGGSLGLMGTATNHPLRLRTNNADRLHIATDGKVGIGNINPGVELDVSGELRIRGGSTDATFTDTRDIAIKNGSSSPGLSFHKDDGTKMGTIRASGGWLSVSVGEEEDEEDKQFNVIVKGQHFLQVHSSGFVGMGPLDAGFNPTLGPLHIYAKGHHRFIVSDPVTNIGTTPVVIIDESGPLEGVYWGFSGFCMIKCAGTGPFKGEFFSLARGGFEEDTTYTVQIDEEHAFTFKHEWDSAHMLGYVSDGNLAMDVMVVGMYR